jgi:hypothetical protein
MRRTIGSNGMDTTATTQAYLASTVNPLMFDLYIIGPPDSPNSIWLTNYEAPLIYGGLPKQFNPAVISRDMVTAKIGLDPQELGITWTPPLATGTVSTTSATPYQLAAQHFYDNWPVQIYRTFMPSPGDCNSLGVADWFGGRVNTVKIARNKLVFNCKSYLDVVTQKVPSTVIEITNTLASTAASTIPSGDTSIPVFSCFTGSTETTIYADCLSPTAGKIYSGDLFAGGYLVFLSGTGATLAGVWSGIGQNGSYTDGNGNKHSQFQIYAALPWPPTPGVDTFYVSLQAPMDYSSGNPSGFPFVPSTSSSV